MTMEKKKFQQYRKNQKGKTLTAKEEIDDEKHFNGKGKTQRQMNEQERDKLQKTSKNFKVLKENREMKEIKTSSKNRRD